MIQVNRKVEYFYKYNEQTEELGELVGSCFLPDVTLRQLKKIVSAKKDDIYLYDVYDLNEEQLKKINALLIEPMEYFLDKYDYCLTCSAVNGYYKNHNTRGNRKGGYPAP